MSRSKHQFRPDTPEVFEERITPTVTAIPGQVPFTPPGQVVPYTPVSGYTYGPGTNGGPFTVSGDIVSITLTNNTGSGQYLTFTAYTAPGGGDNKDGNAYDNLSSQKLIYSETKFVAAGDPVTFTFDVSKLPTSGPNKLNGQDKFQADVFQGIGSTPYAAPEKATNGNGNQLIIGELFDWQGKPAPGGK